MRFAKLRHITVLTLPLIFLGTAHSAEICQGYGPQTPRDIASKSGTNPISFAVAPPSTEMNLCNIHFHKNAEHKAPGFSRFAGATKYGGYQCNGTDDLTESELAAPKENYCDNVKPGDTIEVHWVHTSCDITPGPSLGSCLSEACSNPQLRVETRVFLVVNDSNAAHLTDFGYNGNMVNGRHQAQSLPGGDPITFLGSTTGPKYTEQSCSPLQVTWSVPPTCAKIDINSIDEWCHHNEFDEHHAHGVRQLVTSPELLSEIE